MNTWPSPQEAESARQFQARVPALLKLLGMPPRADWRRITLDGPITKARATVQLIIHQPGHVVQQPLPTSLLLPYWEGYTFEVFGCIPDDPSGREHWPGWEIDDTLLQVWLQTASVPGAPVLAMIRWHPNTGILNSLPVIRDDWSDNDLSKAGRGLRLLQGLLDLFDRPRRGRPGDYDEAREPAFFDELAAASHEAVRQGERVNYSTLARYGLAKSRATVKNYIEHFEYDLDAIELEAVRCTKKLNICSFIWRRRADFKKRRG